MREALPVAQVHRVQQLLSHRFRQVGEQVGEIVDFHALGGRDQLFGLHLVHHVGAHALAEFEQHLALELRIDDLPDDFALRRRQRLEQQRDVGRVHRVDHAMRRAQRPLVERVPQRREAPGLQGFQFAIAHGTGSVHGPARARGVYQPAAAGQQRARAR